MALECMLLLLVVVFMRGYLFRRNFSIPASLTITSPCSCSTAFFVSDSVMRKPLIRPS